jgi:hypothetical protein
MVGVWFLISAWTGLRFTTKPLKTNWPALCYIKSHNGLASWGCRIRKYKGRQLHAWWVHGAAIGYTEMLTPQAQLSCYAHKSARIIRCWALHANDAPVSNRTQWLSGALDHLPWSPSSMHTWAANTLMKRHENIIFQMSRRNHLCALWQREPHVRCLDSMAACAQQAYPETVPAAMCCKSAVLESESLTQVLVFQAVTVTVGADNIMHNPAGQFCIKVVHETL